MTPTNRTAAARHARQNAETLVSQTAVEAYLARGGVVHVIPQGKTALPPRLTFGDVQRMFA